MTNMKKLALIACAVGATTINAASFQEVQARYNEVVTPEALATVSQYVEPMVGSLDAMKIDPLQILAFIMATAFGNMNFQGYVDDNFESYDEFNSQSKLIIDTILNGFFSHLTYYGDENPKVEEISVELQGALGNLNHFMYNVSGEYLQGYTDVTDALQQSGVNIETMQKDIASLMGAFKDFMAQIKNLSPKSIPTLDHLEGIAFEAQKLADSFDTQELQSAESDKIIQKLACKIEPLVLKGTMFLAFATNDAFQQDLVDIIKLLTDLHSTNKWIEQLLLTVKDFQKFLIDNKEEIGDFAMNVIDVDDWLKAKCEGKSSQPRSLAELGEFIPKNFIFKIVHLVEGILKAVGKVITAAKTKTNDLALQVLVDMVSVLDEKLEDPVSAMVADIKIMANLTPPFLNFAVLAETGIDELISGFMNTLEELKNIIVHFISIVDILSRKVTKSPTTEAPTS